MSKTINLEITATIGEHGAVEGAVLIEHKFVGEGAGDLPRIMQYALACEVMITALALEFKEFAELNNARMDERDRVSPQEVAQAVGQMVQDAALRPSMNVGNLPGMLVMPNGVVGEA